MNLISVLIIKTLNTYKGTPDEKIIACDGIFYASQIHIANDTSKCYVEFNEIDDLYGDYNHGRYDAISAISTLKANNGKWSIYDSSKCSDNIKINTCGKQCCTKYRVCVDPENY
ncbi:hypothetical protein H8356DRAFT_1068686 [Neocallimastix lanati (nom. inval.)]|nr:hypothetical protein H8356DRAFT_1068686 [Neocallimastix sp. JGI-2020a]